MKHRLYRSGTDKVFGGVCGGLANYFNIDVVIVRIIFVATALVWGLSFVLYLVLWVAVPQEPVRIDRSQDFIPEVEEETERREPIKSKKAKEIFAIVLIVLGIFITIDNLFVWFSGRLYFPMILILLGLLILFYSNRKGNNVEPGNE